MYKIAISGKAKSGKNTVASLFADVFHLEYKMSAFADPIKQIAKNMFPEALDECLYGASELRSNIISDKYKDKDGNPLTYRQALIDIGKLGRKYNYDIWVINLMKDFYQCNKQLYMVPDLRFVNEFNALKEEKFSLIRVIRNKHLVINDVSETEQDKLLDADFDYIIDNNWSMGALKDSITAIIQDIKSKSK